MCSIAVIIPFYQERSGILTRALRSIEAQDATTINVRVVVVDDESPVPVSEELTATKYVATVPITWLKQLNGGPGAARNAALDHLQFDPPDFVAFLDSDDVWMPDHLSRALAVLGQSADFYGADHVRVGSAGETFFDSHPETRDVLNRLSSGSSIFGGRRVFDLEGHCALRAFIENYIVQTSTVIFRWSALKQLRFDVALRSAGEDNMFWMRSSQISRQCKIDTIVAVKCMDGVNIYENSMDWMSRNTLIRSCQLLLLWSKADEIFRSDPSVREAVKERRRNFARFFGYLWFKHLVAHKTLNINLLRLVLRGYKGMARILLSGAVSAYAHKILYNKLNFVEH